MKFRHAHDELLFFSLDIHNEKTTLNQNTLKQKLETQSTRHN